MWRFEFHLISFATLPCESRNTENVILQLDYYQRKLHKLYNSFMEMDQGYVPYIY